VVAGWSLGGQLALQWARRYPQRIRKLILVSTTPRFVTAPDWSHGMDAEDFNQFAGLVATDSAQALRRFLLLETQGDAQARKVARQLEAALGTRPDPEAPLLMRTLDWLRDTDLRTVLHDIAQPALVVHGDCDRITPLAAGEYLAAQLSGARLEWMSGAAHVPFVSDPATFSRRIAEFCNE
jgi:pimeloyl-[acyl-carrier protein] methyl ester esterase